MFYLLLVILWLMPINCGAYFASSLSGFFKSRYSSSNQPAPESQPRHMPRYIRNIPLPSSTSTVYSAPNLAFDESTKLNRELNELLLRENFLSLPQVVRLLDDGSVMQSDIEELWDSFVGDSIGVTQEEAYELLSMVQDLPDPEDMQYCEEQFLQLAKGSTVIDWSSILNWSDTRDLMNEDAITLAELKSLCSQAVGNVTETADILLNIAQFRILNRLLDDFLDEKEEGTPMANTSSAVNDTPEMDVWSSAFDPLSVLDEDMVTEYTDYFVAKAGSTAGSLTVQDFMAWSDIQELLAEGSITMEALELAWKEAAAGAAQISYDRFLRLNVRLDLLMDDDLPDTEDLTDSATMSAKASGGAAVQTDTTSGVAVMRENQASQESQLAMMISEDELQLMEALDQAENLLNAGAFGDFDRLPGGAEDLRLAALQPARPSAVATAAAQRELQDLLEQVVLLGRDIPASGVGISAVRDAGLRSSDRVSNDADEQDTNEDESEHEQQIAQLCTAIQAVIDLAPPIATTRELGDIRRALLGRWKLLFTNSEMCSFYHGVTGFANVIPRAKFSQLSVEYTSDGYISEAKYLEKIATPLGQLAATAYTNWELMNEPSFMTNAQSIVLRNYCSKVTAGPFTYEAQENWKSLRALAMNEVMYVDEKVMIVRNCGALGVYFVFEREL